MYNPFDREMKEFIERLSFGVLPYEVITKKFSITPASGMSLYNQAHRYVKNFAASQQWVRYANALLQSRSGLRESAFVQGRRGSNSYRRLSKHIQNNTQILAKNTHSALARIFFEIDCAIDKMIQKGDVTKGCGFRTLKVLYSSKTPLTIVEIMKRCGIQQTADYFQKRYYRKVIARLTEIGFVKERFGEFSLNLNARIIFEQVEQKSRKMRAFEYRVRWFYPFEKT